MPETAPVNPGPTAARRGRRRRTERSVAVQGAAATRGRPWVTLAGLGGRRLDLWAGLPLLLLAGAAGDEQVQPVELRPLRGDALVLLVENGLQPRLLLRHGRLEAEELLADGRQLCIVRRAELKWGAQRVSVVICYTRKETVNFSA